jgi:hypothetical protein
MNETELWESPWFTELFPNLIFSGGGLKIESSGPGCEKTASLISGLSKSGPSRTAVPVKGSPWHPDTSMHINTKQGINRNSAGPWRAFRSKVSSALICNGSVIKDEGYTFNTPLMIIYQTEIIHFSY